MGKRQRPERSSRRACESARVAAVAVASVAAASVVIAASSATGVIYVDDSAPPGGDGSSWASPHRLLQEALVHAAEEGGLVTEIRLGAGTYRPDLGRNVITGDREATFQGAGGVSLVGGYAGFGAPEPEARDPARWESVLSGDLAGNDGADFAGNAENSHRLVSAPGPPSFAPLTLDGLVLRGGNGDGAPPFDRGSALSLPPGATTIVRDCRFESNEGVVGGAIFASTGALSIEGGSFKVNRASVGGAIFVQASELTLADTLFEANEAVSGGAIRGETGSLDASSATFRSNSASFEGAALSLVGVEASLDGCTFEQNVAVFDGGGAMIIAGTSVLDGCIFDGNAADRGGGVRALLAAGTLSACSFTENEATEGGGAHIEGVVAPFFDDCTFEENFADEGGGLYGRLTSVELAGCVFAQNLAVQRGGAGAFLGGDFVIATCAFTDNAVFFDGGGALHLEGGTGAPGAGSIAWTWFGENESNFGGAVAIVSSSPAFTDCVFFGNEGVEGAGVRHVGGEPTFDGCRFEGNTAAGGVSAGGAGLHSTGSAALVECLFLTNVADDDGGGAWFGPGEPRLDGCTFLGNEAGREGGAFFNKGALVAHDCTITHNTAAQILGGGAVRSSAGARLTLVRSTIAENSSPVTGGIVAEGAFLGIASCTIHGNAGGPFGGVLAAAGEIEIVDTTIAGNIGSVGAGVALTLAIAPNPALVVNCTLTENGGPAIFVGAGVAAAVRNSILWGNAGPAFVGAPAAVVVEHCDIAGGWSGSGSGNIDSDPMFHDAAGLDLELSPRSPCVDAGLVSALPADRFDLDGDGVLAEALPLDHAGRDRVIGESVDIGAFELDGGCAADLGEDGSVGFSDLTALLIAWGPCPVTPVPPPCLADLDGNGQVGFADLTILLVAWGACVPPA